MPRHARLDAPGTLHHGIIRGLDRGRIVRDDADRQAFVSRLAALVQATRTPVYAWALLPNHAHVLLRTGPVGLSTVMRRRLTGYAVTFNRRHRRVGHLFQNRYKSIVCEDDPYVRELTRYIHLNPLRAGLVPDLLRLEDYPWGGHAGLLGRVPQPWLAAAAVLPWFGSTPPQARRAYRRYVAEGVHLGHLPGGAKGRRVVRQPGKQRPPLERLLAEAEAQPPQPDVRHRPQAVARLIRTVCAQAGIGDAELRSGSRRQPVVQGRAEVARTLVRTLGFSLAAVARELGVSTSAICRAARKAGE